MPRTIQCTRCGVVLNLPAHVAAGQAIEVPKMRDPVRGFGSGREFDVDRSRIGRMPLPPHSIWTNGLRTWTICRSPRPKATCENF